MKKHISLIRLPIALISLHGAQFVCTHFFRNKTENGIVSYFIKLSCRIIGANLLTNLFQPKKTPAINPATYCVAWPYMEHYRDYAGSCR
jgi:hypothetical protein